MSDNCSNYRAYTDYMHLVVTLHKGARTQVLNYHVIWESTGTILRGRNAEVVLHFAMHNITQEEAESKENL